MFTLCGFIHKSVLGSQQTLFAFSLDFPSGLYEWLSGWKLGDFERIMSMVQISASWGFCSLMTEFCSCVFSCIFWNFILFTSGPCMLTSSPIPKCFASVTRTVISWQGLNPTESSQQSYLVGAIFIPVV